MRTLTETLEAAQQKGFIKALVKVVLTHGATTHTYDKSRILKVDETEDGELQSAEVTLNNADGSLTDLNFKGYDAVLSFGAITSLGEEYSACPPMKVASQQLGSDPDSLTCLLTLAGAFKLMMEDHASASYLPESDDTKTVKQLIREIVGDTGVTMLACFNHCQKYDVVFDSEDSLIGTYVPADSFRIYVNGDRKAALDRLLGYTKCVMLMKADGDLHVCQPTVSGSVYDYEYSLSG